MLKKQIIIMLRQIKSEKALQAIWDTVHYYFTRNP